MAGSGTVRRMVEVVVRASGTEETGAKTDKLTGSVGKYQLAWAAAGAAVVAAVVSIVKEMDALVTESAELQTALAEVNTLLEVQPEALDAVKESIIEMSKAYGQSAQTLTKAQYNIVSAGFADAADSAEILAVSAKAATAGLTDTNTAARAITAVINAYGLEVSDAAEVSDTLFATVKAGVTTFPELAGNIGNVISAAAAAKVPFEEVSAALAAMTKNGVSTAESTTALNGLLLALAAPTAEVADKLRELDINLGRDGLGGTLAKLGSISESGLGPLRELVPNIRALKAATAAGKDEAKQFNEVLEDMAANADETGAAFDIMSETLEFAERQLDASKHALRELIGERGLADKTRVLEAQAAAVDKVTEAIGDENIIVSIAQGRWTEFNLDIASTIASAADVSIAVKKLNKDINEYLGADDFSTAAAMENSRRRKEALEKEREKVAELVDSIKEHAAGPALEFPDVVLLEEERAEAGVDLPDLTSTEQRAKGVAMIADEISASMAAIDSATTVDEIDKIIEATRGAKDAIIDAGDHFNRYLAAGMMGAMDSVLWHGRAAIETINDLEDAESARRKTEEKAAQDRARELRDEARARREAERSTREFDRYIAEQAKLRKAEHDAIMADLEAGEDLFDDPDAGGDDAAHNKWLEQQAEKEASAMRLQDSYRQMGRAFSSSMADVIMSAESAGEALKSLLNTAARLALQFAISSFLPFSGGGSVPAMAMGGAVPAYRAAAGMIVPDGPRGMDSVPIMAMPGEGVIRRETMGRLERMLSSWESSAFISPAAIPMGGGGGTTVINYNIRRPVSMRDHYDMGADAAEAVRSDAEGYL